VKASAADRRIRSLRGPKPFVDPWKAHGSVIEPERRPGGAIEQTLTVFLAGAECSFTCSFCDLWRFTIDTPTPPGALPRQLTTVLQSMPNAPRDRLKLYNASNFFDRRAVPREDEPAIAAVAAGFTALTVESHANTIGPQVAEFARRIPCRFEVAVGLETIHPEASAHLNKRMELWRFDAAAAFLANHGIDLRVFVLLGTPYVPADVAVEWAVRSVEYAARRGAALVSVIPVRGGNGELESLARTGHFTPPTLAQLETTLDRCVGFAPAVVTADLWDVDRLPACPECRTARVERLRHLNLRGAPAAPVSCSACDAR